MILQLEDRILWLCQGRHRAKDEFVQPIPGSKPPQRKLEQRSFFQAAWILDHARGDLAFQPHIEAARKNQSARRNARKISIIPVWTVVSQKPARGQRYGNFLATQFPIERADFLQQNERSRTRLADSRDLETGRRRAKKIRRPPLLRAEHLGTAVE